MLQASINCGVVLQEAFFCITDGVWLTLPQHLILTIWVIKMFYSHLAKCSILLWMQLSQNLYIESIIHWTQDTQLPVFELPRLPSIPNSPFSHLRQITKWLWCCHETVGRAAPRTCGEVYECVRRSLRRDREQSTDPQLFSGSRLTVSHSLLLFQPLVVIRARQQTPKLAIWQWRGSHQLLCKTWRD